MALEPDDQDARTVVANWVVRGGEAKPADLVAGYGPHKAVPGLYGFSVQYAPGKAISELAQAAQFPNAMISYASVEALTQVIQPLRYTFRLVSSPGAGYHHAFVALYDATMTIETRLPPNMADAISAVLIRIPNPHRSLRPRRKP